ncbi:MAG: extracellular solute-binding protein [Clostridium sp.]|jgi:ABC-type glycerol-3-phosphate transport system substrate-binding protein|nr:extracellular solute-binding protein [Clostridium sp.]
MEIHRAFFKEHIEKGVKQFLFLCIVAFLFSGCATNQNRESITIAMPQGEYIRNLDDNYYLRWLEEKSGLELNFVLLDDAYAQTQLDAAFASGSADVDAFFAFDTGGDYRTQLNKLQEYADAGYILPIDPYLDNESNLSRAFDAFDAYDLRDAMTGRDGQLYFYPGLDTSSAKETGSILWLNKNWLSNLSLPVPTTTDELRDVLMAFKTGDPNGNGVADEIPLCGSAVPYGQQCWLNLINAFTFDDPENSRLIVEDGQIVFAPQTDDWREAMIYLNDLYTKELIDPMALTLSPRSLLDLANSPSDILGGFTADELTDVALQNSSEILSKYIHVAPLTGPDGKRRALGKTVLPTIAGVISASCENPEAVVRLFDLMLSEEAFLIGRYGEENVDWARGGVTDMDFYGNPASVRVINRLNERVQNKQISELGPYFAWQSLADSVSYTGFDSDAAYIDARAHLAYVPFVPKENIGALLVSASFSEDMQQLRRQIDAYTDQCIIDFMTGVCDPSDEAQWAEVQKAYKDMGIDELVSSVQAVYDVNR